MLKKQIWFVIGLIFLFSSNCFAFSKAEHNRALTTMANVPREFGGLGGKFSTNDIEEFQSIVDKPGGGVLHRNNGSHTVEMAAKLMPKVASGEWDMWATTNAFAIHNVLDMAHSGPEGTNGWKCTPERQAEAKTLSDKLVKGIPVHVEKWPKWAVEAGIEVGKTISKITAKVTEFITIHEGGKIIYLAKLAGQYSVWIYVAIDGGNTGYKVLSGRMSGEEAVIEILGIGGCLGGAALIESTVAQGCNYGGHWAIIGGCKIIVDGAGCIAGQWGTKQLASYMIESRLFGTIADNTAHYNFYIAKALEDYSDDSAIIKEKYDEDHKRNKKLYSSFNLKTGMTVEERYESSGETFEEYWSNKNSLIDTYFN